ncbi:Smr protein/MutS2, partial [Burkholderia sp. H160]
GEVAPLAMPPRATLTRHPPPPLPVQTLLDEEAVLHEAISDEFDPEVLLETDETLSYCRLGVSRDVVRKLRRGDWIVQAQIDLHGMRREEAREALAEFIRESVKRGLRCLRVIHGKGLGSIGKEPVLKGKVRAWLVQKSEVIAFCQARPHDGGAGAVVVLLQPGASPAHGANPKD